MLISKMIYNSYRSNKLIKQEGLNIIDASFKTMWGVPPIFVITNFIILMFTNIIGSNSILILIPMMITLIRGIRIFKKAKSKQIIV